MTIGEMFNELENKVRDTFIVTLKYKYDFEEEYTIENQILEYDALNDDYVWLNDWREGQTDIEVLGYMLLGDVDTAKPLTCEDAISRQAAIDVVRKWFDKIQLNSDICLDGIISLPSVTPKTEPCEDCISREAIYEALSEWDEQDVYLPYHFKELVAELPSVMPKGETITEFADRCRECGAKHGELLKSKTGSWIVHPKGGCAHLVCSKCLSDAPFDCKTNFCPNCGSRMIEPQESESDD